MAQPLFNEHPLQDYLRRSFALAFSPHLLTLHLFQDQAISLNLCPAQCLIYQILSPKSAQIPTRTLTSSCGPGYRRLHHVLFRQVDLVSTPSRRPYSVGRSDWRKLSSGVTLRTGACARPSLELHSLSRSRHFLSSLSMAITMSMILNVLIFQFFNIIVTSVQNHHSTLQEFSEKFQYDVVSSSLLSSSVTAPSSTRRRSSSSTRDAPSDDPDLKSGTIPSRPAEPRSTTWSLTLFCLCCISLFFDSFILCVLMGTALYYIESHTAQPGNLPDFIAPVGS